MYVHDNNTVMIGDRWLLDLLWSICNVDNVKLLCCTTETDILYVNYTSVKKIKRKNTYVSKNLFWHLTCVSCYSTNVKYLKHRVGDD